MKKSRLLYVNHRICQWVTASFRERTRKRLFFIPGAVTSMFGWVLPRFPRREGTAPKLSKRYDLVNSSAPSFKLKHPNPGVPVESGSNPA
jgi:hypothetical protein